jgi:uncharacterized protein
MIGIGHRYWRSALTRLNRVLIVGFTLAASMTSAWAQNLQDKIAFANRDISSMWTRQFLTIGRTWRVPRTIGYIGRLPTPCGIIGNGNAQYCPRNHTIYLNHLFVSRVNQRVGDFAAVTVLAHEYGHAVQRQLGLSHANRYPVQDELQADCFAGVYAQDAMDRNLLDASDIPEATAQSYASGDPSFRWNAHGTPQQRVDAFRLGYLKGFQACTNYATWKP